MCNTAAVTARQHHTFEGRYRQAQFTKVPEYITKRIIKPTKTERLFYLTLHRIADKIQPRAIRQFRTAIENIKGTTKMRALQTAIRASDNAAILDAIGIDGLERELQVLSRELQAVYADSAIAAMAILPKSISTQINFDLLNQNSVNRLRDFGGTFITGITNTTRSGILSIIEDVFNEGGGTREMARRIKDGIGLTARQAKAVDNFRRMLVSEGVAPDIVKRRVNAYYQRQLRWRAKNIARTETIRAANAGQREIWSQAVEQGLLDPNTARKVWVITPDDRLCPICEPIPSMNPDGVPIDGTFDTPVGRLQGPPAHPQCRCAEAIGKF